MTTYFVSRHSGALDWAREQGVVVDRQVEHLDPTLLRVGDWVLGTLPIHLAAAVCECDARYIHLSLEVPRSERGKQLTVRQMRDYHARLECYDVTRHSTQDV